MRLGNVAADILCQNFRFAAARGNDRERAHRISDFLRIAAMNIGDPFAIRAPGRRAFEVGMRISLGRKGKLSFFYVR